MTPVTSCLWESSLAAACDVNVVTVPQADVLVGENERACRKLTGFPVSLESGTGLRAATSGAQAAVDTGRHILARSVRSGHYLEAGRIGPHRVPV